MPPYVESFRPPIRVTLTPSPGTVAPGTEVTFDANVASKILYTVDGSAPEEGEVGTYVAYTPFVVELRTSTTIRYKAFDSRVGFESNESRTLQAVYTVVRNNPIETYKTNHFYLRLNRAIVDAGFYFGPEEWVVPVSKDPFSYVFVNREPFSVRVRLLHNGSDTITGRYPIVPPSGSHEFMITPVSGDNEVVIMVANVISGQVALYDIGEYDVDSYGDDTNPFEAEYDNSEYDDDDQIGP